MLRAALAAAAVLVLVLTGIGIATSDDPAAPSRAAPSEARSTDSVTALPRTRLKPSPSSPSSPNPATGVPTRVAVPRLGIDVPVIPIAPEGGVLVPPDNPRELGWYRYGARPGAFRGSAVITGHTVHTGGGALDELDDLRTGDTARVSTAKGTIGYRVSRVSILSKNQLAKRAQQVFSSTVPGRLVLITCTDWNGQEYLSNTLVYADPDPEPLPVPVP
jgi:LPXTG-site transpeptidase (sortase) family protein